MGKLLDSSRMEAKKLYSKQASNKYRLVITITAQSSGRRTAVKKKYRKRHLARFHCLRISPRISFYISATKVFQDNKAFLQADG